MDKINPDAGDSDGLTDELHSSSSSLIQEADPGPLVQVIDIIMVALLVDLVALKISCVNEPCSLLGGGVKVYLYFNVSE